MAFTTSGPNWILATCFFIVTAIITSHLTNGQCPWPKNLTQLNTACACSYVQSKLSVQCSAVNMTKLLTTLRESEEKLPLELLQVSNSSLPHLTDDSFYNLRISTIKFQKCDISNISSNAFRDLEDVLLSLNLPDNRLSETMLPNLRNLRALTSLDISNNNIQQLPDDAFRGLNLDTLNLMENNVTTISPGSFKSLEKTLKNLNLKGCGLKTLPDAIRNLTSLAFLDLAQNKIQNVSSGFFTNMKSLTALSLEKNQIQHLEVNAFAGLENSMSSLSLLNNQFDHMPTEAVTILKELRVNEQQQHTRA